MKKLRKRNASTCFAQRLLTDWNTFPCWLDKKGARLSCSIMLCSLSPCTHRGTSRSRSWNTERHIGMAQHYSTCYSTTACYPPQTVICGGRWEAYDDEKHIHTVYSWRVNRRFSRKIPCLRSHILSHLRLRSFACCVVIVVAFKFSRSLSRLMCVQSQSPSAIEYFSYKFFIIRQLW